MEASQVLILILLMALLSPWFLVVAALGWSVRMEKVQASMKRHPSGARASCPVCGAHTLEKSFDQL
jgi:hypothetical protein